MCERRLQSLPARLVQGPRRTWPTRPGRPCTAWPGASEKRQEHEEPPARRPPRAGAAAPWERAFGWTGSGGPGRRRVRAGLQGDGIQGRPGLVARPACSATRAESRPWRRGAPPSWPCCGKARAMVTRSCPRSRSAAAGAWRPSPGAVYPALQLLADEGLIIAAEESGGRRTFSLTEAGRQHIEEDPEAGPPRPGRRWRRTTPARCPGLFRAGGPARRQHRAAGPRRHAGPDPARAEQLLERTRRQMYQILASDEAGRRG